MTPRQERYAGLVKNERVFDLVGMTLVEQDSGERFPVAMAKKIGLRPKKVKEPSRGMTLEAAWKNAS